MSASMSTLSILYPDFIITVQTCINTNVGVEFIVPVDQVVSRPLHHSPSHNSPHHASPLQVGGSTTAASAGSDGSDATLGLPSSHWAHKLLLHSTAFASLVMLALPP